MQRVLPEDAVLVSGITNMGWAHFAYRSRQPRTYLTSSYFATLGFSFPVALGAKVALPECPVVSITGDGGFMYALPELATAVHYGIGVVVVVFVDNALGASKNDQRTRFKGARSVPPCTTPALPKWRASLVPRACAPTQNISTRPCKRRSRPGSRQ